jgi:hypothetical protein
MSANRPLYHLRLISIHCESRSALPVRPSYRLNQAGGGGRKDVSSSDTSESVSRRGRGWGWASVCTDRSGCMPRSRSHAPPDAARPRGPVGRSRAPPAAAGAHLRACSCAAAMASAHSRASAADSHRSSQSCDTRARGPGGRGGGVEGLRKQHRPCDSRRPSAPAPAPPCRPWCQRAPPAAAARRSATQTSPRHPARPCARHGGASPTRWTSLPPPPPPAAAHLERCRYPLRSSMNHVCDLPSRVTAAWDTTPLRDGAGGALGLTGLAAGLGAGAGAPPEAAR